MHRCVCVGVWFAWLGWPGMHTFKHAAQGLALVVLRGYVHPVAAKLSPALPAVQVGQRHYYFMNIGNGEVIDAARKVRAWCAWFPLGRLMPHARCACGVPGFRLTTSSPASTGHMLLPEQGPKHMWSEWGWEGLWARVPHRKCECVGVWTGVCVCLGFVVRPCTFRFRVVSKPSSPSFQRSSLEGLGLLMRTRECTHHVAAAVSCA